jgi:hypothetical protein
LSPKRYEKAESVASCYRHRPCAAARNSSNKQNTNKLTKQLTPWSKILFQKRTASESITNDRIFGGSGDVYIHHPVQKPQLYVPYLSQTNSLYVPPFFYFKIHFNIILPFTPKSWQVPLSFSLTHHNPAATCLPIRATCPANLILNFIILRTFSEQYKLRRCSLCNFLQSTVSYSPFCPTLHQSPVLPSITQTKQLI